MKSKKSIFFNGILFFGIFALTVAFVFKGKNIDQMVEYICECEMVWLIPAVFCVLFYIWGESNILWRMLHAYNIEKKKTTCFLFSSIGFFFSCITPSATGGQPMQLYYMKKERIPVPVASVILIIVTITYKAVLVLLGIGVIVFARGFLDFYFEDFSIVFYLGIFLNVVCVVAMIMMLLCTNLVKSIVLWIFRFLEKFHFLKNTDTMYSKIENAMISYHDTSEFMFTHRLLILKVLFITIVQRFALFAVTCFVYKAFDLVGTSLLRVIILQGMIAVAVDMLPLPGGMGISESLFLVVFQPVFGKMVLPGMVLSRGIGYYSELLISALFTLVALIVFSKREKRQNQTTG